MNVFTNSFKSMIQATGETITFLGDGSSTHPIKALIFENALQWDESVRTKVIVEKYAIEIIPSQLPRELKKNDRFLVRGLEFRIESVLPKGLDVTRVELKK